MKCLERNFLPGRQFVDIVDLTEQLANWNATIADVRIHGTTHERPIDVEAACNTSGAVSDNYTLRRTVKIGQKSASAS